MAKQIVNEYAPDEVSHPGETLLDVLEERGMSQAELADRTGRPKKIINEIIKGKLGISPETAIQLERSLGVPASFWNKRQQEYDESVARRTERDKLQQHLTWLSNFPVSAMVKAGYVTPGSDRIERLRGVLNFFGVASPEAFDRYQGMVQVQYRQSARFDADRFALAAWLRRGELLAQRMECGPFSRQALRGRLGGVRRLTVLSPEDFVPRLQRICSEAGVAVVFVPELPKIRAYGATYWLGNRAVIQLCLRGKKDDVLWFTFFHEVGHLLLHGRKRAIFLEVEEKTGTEEEEADHFASEILIRKKDLDAFVRATPRLSAAAITRFAEAQGIAPGIVVGQLHYFGYAPFDHFQRLRQTLAWR
ncbi:MAG: addiction module antidote protein, HigA family [Acidobacteria bacterium]|nr:MAG: addiction module antidote protein, HigA family [Acidobacteriota bacterium]